MYRILGALFLTAVFSNGASAGIQGSLTDCYYEIIHLSSSYLPINLSRKSVTEFISASGKVNAKGLVGSLSEVEVLKTLYKTKPVPKDGNLLNHSIRALEIYNQQFPFLPKIKTPKGVNLSEVIPATLAIHDIGKAVAFSNQDFRKVSEYTAKMVAPVLKELGFNPKEVVLGTELASSDAIENVIHARGSGIIMKNRLQESAEKVGMSEEDYQALQTLFFTCDFASNPDLLKKVFKKENGKLVIDTPEWAHFQRISKLEENKPKKAPSAWAQKVVAEFSHFGSSVIRNYLRFGDDTLGVAERKTEDFNRAIKEMPKYSGKVYRFIEPYDGESYQGFVARLMREKEFSDLGPASTTKDPFGVGYWGAAEKGPLRRSPKPASVLDTPFGKRMKERRFIRLELNVRNARDISYYSAHKGEEEVVLLPGTKFHKPKVTWGKYGEAYIEWQQK